MQSPRYYILYFLSFLLHFVGIVGLRLLTIAVGIGIAFLLEDYLGKTGMTIGWIVSLIIFGIAMIGLERIYPYLEKFDDYAKAHKKYPFIEKYGADYPQPTPEKFGISDEEFKEYNNRFQFELIKLIATYGLWITGCIYSIKLNLPTKDTILLIGSAGAGAILLNHFFEFWNKNISKRHRSYEKINRYQKAVKIYHQILREKMSV